MLLNVGCKRLTDNVINLKQTERRICFASLTFEHLYNKMAFNIQKRYPPLLNGDTNKYSLIIPTPTFSHLIKIICLSI